MPNTVGQIERKTQDRVIKHFQDKLDYEYLGNWEYRMGNSCIEEEYLNKFLVKQGYSESQIRKALFELQKVAKDQSKSLYDTNKEIYSMLRYGIKVQKVGENKQTIFLIDWDNPENNHFAIAEEVTIKSENTKRPDVVIYVNGIALGVIELKRSKISVAEGIRQNLDNQKDMFIKNFFATIQFVMAGNDTEYLRYGTIETPEKYYLEWKDDETKVVGLDEQISQLLNKERFLEIIHDFIVYDKGVKKICRPNQYFGVKAVQEKVKNREGGIFWHTQGSGKSLSMVWIAKWIKENITDSRILIVTDRIELDEQIEGVFIGVGEDKIHRTTSGADLLDMLANKEKTIVSSLIHKFGGDDESDASYDKFISEIQSRGFEAKGDIYVFVDECHRTQSGKLHEAMKAILPNSVFIGFTGTPLLKEDKKKSLEVFGGYIHTYKFDKAVEDGVVLDLRYEARDIDQKITSQEKIDIWFEAKTKGLTDVAKLELKRKWGTMQTVLSSLSRLNKIVSDILLDFEIKPRLFSGSGNAMLVAGSIYEACKYYEIFQDYGFKKCAIVTSYEPTTTSIKGETTGEDNETGNIKKYKVYKKMLADWFKLPENQAINKVDKFEEEVKKKFVDEPGQMKLLIVVDKLLTGFDAPSATYLYIDKKMQDHGLFQAICRVNRLDGQSKEFGYIIDYKDLFKKVENAIEDYTSEAFDNFEEEDVKGLIKDRLGEGKKHLDELLEKVKALCEGVEEPKGSVEYIRYFVGDIPEETAQKRQMLYKSVSSLLRAYAQLAGEMTEAGYTEDQQTQIGREVGLYSDIKDEIKLASGDYIDLKLYEPDMRHLIDSYISAEESQKISGFEDTSLLELIVEKGIEEAIATLPTSITESEEAVAETIDGNVRRLITDEREVNPAYYQKMSNILDEIIRKRRLNAKSYREYLRNISELIGKLKGKDNQNDYPKSIGLKEQKSLYDNLGENEDLVLKIDSVVKMTKRDDWIGNKIREREVRFAIEDQLKEFGMEDDTNKVLELIKKQDAYK